MIPRELVTATMQERMRAAAREQLKSEVRRLDRKGQSGHGRQSSGRVSQLLYRFHAVLAQDTASA